MCEVEVGLNLVIVDEDDEELDSVEVGSYGDFDRFRDTVTTKLEGGAAGSRFPTLILHSNCDGVWSPAEASRLEQELMQIDAGLRALPALAYEAGWQTQIVEEFGLLQETLYDSFFNVDGEPLVERLIDLAKLSQARGLPISFH